jgi:hypothetical protein
VSETAEQVVVYEAGGLEKGVNDCGACKREAAFFQFFGDIFR